MAYQNFDKGETSGPTAAGHDIEYDNAPMGRADAQERQDQDIETSYVDVVSLLPQMSLPSNRLHDAKIVVGRKGSGKTHMLLHIQQLARADGATVVYSHLSEDLFLTHGLFAYRGDRRPEQTVALWTAVWRCAVNMAAMSHFTAQRVTPRARDAIIASLTELGISAEGDPLADFCRAMRGMHGDLIVAVGSPIHPIEAMRLIIQRHRNLNAMLQFVGDGSYSIETDLAVLLHRHGVLHFIIDGLDEFAFSDPRGWIDVQVGLFKATFLLRTIRRFSQYLKLTISLRNYVYTRAAQDPQIDRARSSILQLNWNAASARRFLDRRLAKLAGGNFARSELLRNKRPLAAWLGFDTVGSARRGVRENVEDYVLRHSRLSPRNLVEVFNALCAEQNLCAVEGRALDELRFKEVVENQSRTVGDLMLRVCGEEIIAHLPKMTEQRNRVIAPDYQITDVATKIMLSVADCGHEIVKYPTFQEKLVSGLARRLGYGPDGVADVSFEEIVLNIESILWRSGIFAVHRNGEDPKGWLFSWDSVPAGQPSLARKIGFHSCLIGLCSLEISEDGPAF